MAKAAVYLWSPMDASRRDRPPPGVNEAHEQAATFAARHGYQIVARYHDTGRALPGAGSAFAAMLGHLDDGIVSVVLVAARSWLAPEDGAQSRMAGLIAAHGGTLIEVDKAASAAPPVTRADPRQDTPRSSDLPASTSDTGIHAS